MDTKAHENFTLACGVAVESKHKDLEKGEEID